MALRTAKQGNKKTLSDGGAASDRYLWFVWMGLMVVAIALLPFIVREGAIVRTFASMCMTALGL